MGVWSARSGRAFGLGGAVLLLAGCTGGGPSAGTGDGSAPSSGAQLTAHTEPEPPTPSTTSDPSVVPPTTEGERPDPGAAPSDGTTLGSTGDAGTVTPTITSAIEAGGTIAVSAGVSGIVEEGGTCTLRASGSDHVEVSETAVAFADASSTICEPLTVSTDRLGPRPWTVRLEYASPRHSGSSAPVEVS